MFETITTTTSAALSTSSWINISNATTQTLSTLSTVDFNTTQLWNVSGGSDNNGIIDDESDSCDPTNPKFNCTIDDYLNYYLGAKQMPLETAIWVSTMTSQKYLFIYSYSNFQVLYLFAKFIHTKSQISSD
jgi:hypothetical protein